MAKGESFDQMLARVQGKRAAMAGAPPKPPSLAAPAPLAKDRSRKAAPAQKSLMQSGRSLGRR